MEVGTIDIQFETYPEYKDSGVEWLGELPSHWRLKRLKFCVNIVKRIIGIEGADVLSITQKGIVVKDISSGEGQLAADYSNYQIVEKGDFAMNHMDLLTGYVDLSMYNGVTSPDYRVFKLTDDSIVKKYFLKLLQLCYEGKIFYGYGRGVSQFGRWRLPSSRFNNFLIPIPPKEEQTAIANFLDEKTAKIDEAIAIKQRQIELLKERRQILIHKAVTRGLNPDVPLKPSGVDWIGEIPEHWEVKKLKYLTIGNLKYGANKTGENYDSNLPRYIRITDFGKTGKLKEETKLSLKWEDAKDYLLEDGDILFARSGATVGKTYQFKKEMSEEDYFCYAGYLIKAEADEECITSDYLYMYTTSSIFEKWKDQIFNKATIENIGADKYSQLPVIVPAKEEQSKILKLVRLIDNKIDSAVERKEVEIIKLKEYKTTLINSAVTGKIKVS